LRSGKSKEVTENKKRMKKELLTAVSDSSVIAASNNGKEQNVAPQYRESYHEIHRICYGSKNVVTVLPKIYGPELFLSSWIMLRM
jgi:hypothetical protein